MASRMFYFIDLKKRQGTNRCVEDPPEQTAGDLLPELFEKYNVPALYRRASVEKLMTTYETLYDYLERQHQTEDDLDSQMTVGGWERDGCHLEDAACRRAIKKILDDFRQKRAALALEARKGRSASKNAAE